ncbi:NmrA family NAD(P)-binding protein [Kyrpidia spormannii]|uniref:NmrA family NAD(P)-binding protein n=1 Tax=Kyrpidia spormannii TaxID=2055160 RepID=UPI0018E41048|nr:NmrA family NAD(P)-binding protein [Kyrpidia spormannii]
MEHQFAFLIHPFDRRDITRKLPALAALPDPTLDRLLRHLPPLLVDRIDGVTGAQGVKTSGWLVGTPLTSQQLLELPWPVVYRKLLAAGKKAVRLGAKVLGLGAFTAVAGDAGVSLARRLPIAVTTGNSYTVAIALKAADVGARWMGWDPDRAGWVVMGATGGVGRVSVEILASRGRKVFAHVRDDRKAGEFLEYFRQRGLEGRIEMDHDVRRILSQAPLVITCSSALEAVVQPQDLLPGAVVCDVARPRDVSRQVADHRPDVLVIDGGLVKVPGGYPGTLDLGLPADTVYACMAETMVLAMEGRLEHFSLGRNLTADRVREIAELAKKHGFELAAFRSFERALTREAVERIRREADFRRGEAAPGPGADGRLTGDRPDPVGV